ncbi:MAG: hypothetical protein H0T60_08770, partial [Acidobacteria bacterium]|nr:hypothetical protein [Acidobacteriota bacterium]
MPASIFSSRRTSPYWPGSARRPGYFAVPCGEAVAAGAAAVADVAGV